jgi:hypothetical protein
VEITPAIDIRVRAIPNPNPGLVGIALLLCRVQRRDTECQDNKAGGNPIQSTKQVVFHDVSCDRPEIAALDPLVQR